MTHIAQRERRRKMVDAAGWYCRQWECLYRFKTPSAVPRFCPRHQAEARAWEAARARLQQLRDEQPHETGNTPDETTEET